MRLLAVVLLLIGVWHNTQAQEVIMGAGASFPVAGYQQWFALYSALYNSVQFQYAASSSGTGQTIIAAPYTSPTRIVNGYVVQFAGSDSAISNAIYNQTLYEGVPDIQQVPVIAGAIVVVYNLPGINFELTLSLPVLAKVYLGEITYWDDPEILALNNNQALPHKPIIICVRGDSSGTTLTITTALSRASPAFSSTISTGATTWPSAATLASQGINVTYNFLLPPNGIPGSFDMSFAVNNLQYSLGYVEQTFADQYLNRYAQLINPAGFIVAPSIASIKSAVNSFGTSVFPSTHYFWGSVVYSMDPNSYPLVAYSYLVFYLNSIPDCGIAFELLRFISWTQTYQPAATAIELLNFIIPPAEVVALVVDEVLSKMTCAGSTTPLLPSVTLSLLCPAGTEQSSNGDNSYSCIACQPGYFNLQTNSTCQPCPNGAVCPGGAELLAAQYYWRVPPTNASDPNDPLLINPLFSDCGIGSACCPNGNSALLQGCSFNDSCKVNFDPNSRLCSECLPGLYEWGAKCVPYDGTSWTGIIIGLGYIASLVFVVFNMLIPKWRSNFLGDLIFFYQIASILVQPAFSSSALGILNLNLDTLASDPNLDICLLPTSPFSKFMIVYLAPLILLVNLMLIYVFCLLWIALKKRWRIFEQVHSHLPGWVIDRPLNTLMIASVVEIGMICFMPLILPSLRVFDCITIPGYPYSYLRSSPSIVCFQNPHNGAVVLAVLCLIVGCLCIPIFAFVSVVKRAKAKKLNWSDWKDEYGIFYQQFRPLFYFFYAIDLYERVLILVTAVAFDYSDLSLALALFLVLWLLVYQRIYCAPYRQWLDNVLKVITYLCLSGLALLRALASTNSQETLWTSPAISNLSKFFLYLPLVVLPVKLYFMFIFARRTYRSILLRNLDLSSLSEAQRAHLEYTEKTTEIQRVEEEIQMQDSLPTRIANLLSTPIYVSATNWINVIQKNEIELPASFMPAPFLRSKSELTLKNLPKIADDDDGNDKHD